MKNYTGLWAWLLAVALGVFTVNSASAKTQYLQAQINNKWVYLSADDFEYQVSGEFEGEYPMALFQQASRKQMLTWYKAMQNQTSPTQLDTFEETFSFNFYQALFFNPEIDDLHFNGPTFSIDAFEDEIRSRLDEVAVGYSYALNLSKQYARGDGVGAARLNQDGYVSQSVTKRMNIASISKTLTAVAILQLLEKNGLSIHDPIEPWLPDDWVKGYGFFQGQGKSQPEVVLSFYDLLTHRSGIQQSIAAYSEINQEYKDAVSNKWDGLKTIVEFGVLPAYYQEQLYKNANFALFRIMIPKLWKASGDPAIAIGEITETTAALYYRAYLDSYVLSPSGVHYADCADHSANPTLYYDGAKTWVKQYDGIRYGLEGKALYENITVIRDDRLGELESRVVINTKSGQTLTGRVDVMTNIPPLSVKAEKIQNKVLDILEPVWGRSKASAVLQTLSKLETVDTMADLMRQLKD